MKVAVIMGSTSDWDVMSAACATLEELGIPYEKRVISAHRTPHLMFEYATTARERGIGAIIAGAVFVVLAFVYVAVRYNVKMGIITAIATAVGTALTAGIVALVRIPVTNSIVYVFAVAALLSATTTLLSFNKARANKSQ